MSRTISALIPLVFLLLTGCAHSNKNPTPEIPLCPTFVPGDAVILEFGSCLPSVWSQTVRPDGTISLPFNKTVRVTDKTQSQLEQAIRDIYVHNICTELSVRLRGNSPFFFVTGEVRNPGQKNHPGAMTAMEAIRAAAEFTDFADASNIEIRRADGTRVKVDGKAILDGRARDLSVHHGDTVYVNRRLF